MRRALAFVSALAVLLALPATAGAQTVADVVAGSEDFDGRRLTLTGELIGDYGERRDGTVWTQLNGDSYAAAPVAEGGDLTGGNVGIGIQIPGDLADGLDPPGGYRRVGPVVTVTGEWRHHDPGRGGESYLVVTALEVAEPGRSIDVETTWPVPVAALVIVAGAAYLGWRLRQRSVEQDGGRGR